MSSHCPDPFPRGAATNGAPLSRRSCLRWIATVSAVGLFPIRTSAICPCYSISELASSPPTTKPSGYPSGVLRVCSDPNNLPFSSNNLDGFENKIAAVIADELNVTLQYRWLPQWLGFYREALKDGDSDLVLAAPAGFERALLTKPYYRSTYVFVQRKSAQPISSFDDAPLRTMKIGIQLTGKENPPPAHALSRRGLVGNIVGFPVAQEDSSKHLIDAVASGNVDVAIMWGPPVGYFAHQQPVELNVTPVANTQDDGLPFAFDICMGVRRNDKVMRDLINGAIEKRTQEIGAILDEFHVPRAATAAAAAAVTNDPQAVAR